MLSKQEWNELQQLSYNVLPGWWYNNVDRDKQYAAYVKGYKEWNEKLNWGSPTLDME